MQQSHSSESDSTATGETVHAVGEIVDDAGDRIRSEAAEFLSLAKERGKSLINEQMACIAVEVSQVAEVLQHAADELTEKNNTFASHYATRAARGLSDISDVLGTSDVDAVVSSAERYAARSPVIFLGVSVAAGFLLGRFLLSSAQKAMSSSSRKTRPSDQRYVYPASESEVPRGSAAPGTFEP